MHRTTVNDATINLDHATDALETLPAELRQSLHLRYSSGFDDAQIAALLGLPAEVVRERLRDGLEGLRNALDAAA